MYLQKYINYKQKYLAIKQNMYGGAIYKIDILTHTDKKLSVEYNDENFTINDVKRQLDANENIDYALRYKDVYYSNGDTSINNVVILPSDNIRILQSVNSIIMQINNNLLHTSHELFDKIYLEDTAFLQFLIEQTKNIHILNNAQKKTIFNFFISLFKNFERNTRLIFTTATYLKDVLFLIDDINNDSLADIIIEFYPLINKHEIILTNVIDTIFTIFKNFNSIGHRKKTNMVQAISSIEIYKKISELNKLIILKCLFKIIKIEPTLLEHMKTTSILLILIYSLDRDFDNNVIHNILEYLSDIQSTELKQQVNQNLLTHILSHAKIVEIDNVVNFFISTYLNNCDTILFRFSNYNTALLINVIYSYCYVLNNPTWINEHKYFIVLMKAIFDHLNTLETITANISIEQLIGKILEFEIYNTIYVSLKISVITFLIKMCYTNDNNISKSVKININDIIKICIRKDINIYYLLPPLIRWDKSMRHILIENHNLMNVYRDKKINFLHIGIDYDDNRLETININTDYLEYIFFDILKDNTGGIEKIKDTIKTKENIIFFISVRKNELQYISKYPSNDPDKIRDLCKKFYADLKQYIDSIILEYDENKSIKIINWVNDENDIYLLNRNKYFSKIENIYFTDRDFKKIGNDNTIKLLTDYNNQAKSNNTLLSTHWINWLINTPAAFKGRVQQHENTGGCWLYAAFNVLLFTPTIKQKMIDEMKLYKQSKDILKEKFPIPYNEIRENTDNTIKDIIFSIIWFIANNEHETIENYMIVLAARIKGRFDIKKANYSKLSKIINGYDIFEDIIHKEHLYKICRANDNNKIRMQLCNRSATKTPDEIEALFNLNSLCDYTDKKSDICDAPGEKVDYNLGYVFGYAGHYLYSIHGIISSIFKFKESEYAYYIFLKGDDPINFNELTSQFSLTDYNIYSKLINYNNITLFKIDDLAILNIGIQEKQEKQDILFQKNLSFYGINYKLCGSIWRGKSEIHAICGMLDNEDAYIYDSDRSLEHSNWITALENNTDLYHSEHIYRIGSLLYINLT